MSELILLLDTRIQAPYGHVIGTFWVQEANQLAPFRWRWDLHKGYQYYEGLEVACQIGGTGSAPRRAYGEDLAYPHPYQIRLPEAERTYKTLKRLQDRLQKLTDQEGYHQTFGQYVNRVARAAGVSRVAERTGRWSGYRYSAVGDVVGRVDGLVKDVIKQLFPEAEVTDETL